MLIKALPILITGASFFIAVAFHLLFKFSLLLPSLLAAICTSVIAFLCFKLISNPELVDRSGQMTFDWITLVFSFGSGFVLAILVGYLMKLAPDLFEK